MKILYKNSRFSGGAPLSLLEYVKIAQNHDNEVVAAGEFKYSQKKYIENNVKVYDIPDFKIKKPIYNLKAFYMYYKLVVKEAPDLLHSITPANCYFSKVVSEMLQIPVIYTIPGGTFSEYVSFVLKNEHILVFSDENKQDLIDMGHDEKLITVITNRFSFNEVGSNSISIYNTGNIKTIKLLLISRLDSSKINSVRYVINLVGKLCEKYSNIELTILGDGSFFDEIKEAAETLNKKYSKKLIDMPGYVDEVEDYIKSSHIVFGKGRSVIDSIYNLRVSFIVSEENSMCLCNNDTINMLKYYNFSGRHLTHAYGFYDLCKVVEQVYKINYDFQELLKLRKYILEHYDIKYAEDKILSLYQPTNKRKHNKLTFAKLIKGIYSYLGIYFNWVVMSVQKKCY